MGSLATPAPGIDALMAQLDYEARARGLTQAQPIIKNGIALVGQAGRLGA